MQTYSYQLQSCYFNKKPFLLHCTVKHISDDSHYDIYQICDHMSHDFASISIIVTHLLELEDTGSSVINQSNIR